MTKTQISVRVSSDTMAAIDAAAQQQGVSRGHIVDRWLAAQAAATSPANDAWYRIGLLALQAREDANSGELANAVHLLADCIDELAGTAPEEG